MPSPTEI